MPRLIWSPTALLDIRRLYRFLADKNVDAAKRAIKTIRESVKLMAGQPRVGRLVDGLEPEFREWPIDFGDSGYLVLYRFDGHSVIVVSVRHQKEIGY